MRMTSRTGSARRILREFEERVETRPASWEDGCFSLARRDLCGGCHTCVCVGGGVDEKPRIERLCRSLYVEEPLNSKVIKSFVPEQRSRQVFFVLRDFYVLCYIFMDIRCTFHT